MRTFVISYFDRTGRLIRSSLAQVLTRAQALAQASLGMVAGVSHFELEEI